ncbi:MAG TPA: DUF447 domain-containing protein [Rhodanobacteraceae bacterium]
MRRPHASAQVSEKPAIEASPMIYETVVTTVSASGDAHIAPMGIRREREIVVLKPFKPSRTYENVLQTGSAVVNFTTDTRVFAGCVTGRKDWPCVPADTVSCVRLEGALGHAELQMFEHIDDAVRPVLRMQVLHERIHAGFEGFNRAQAAIIEGAVLVSRLNLLSREKIETEMAYLQIAIDKTAGNREREAWSWLCDAVKRHYDALGAGSAPA